MNKIEVLDKGWVNMFSSSMEGNRLLEYVRAYKLEIDEDILDMPQIHMEIKCPLFVQLNLNKFNFRMTIKKSSKMEAFIPTVDQIKAKDHETDVEIQKNIEATTEALRGTRRKTWGAIREG